VASLCFREIANFIVLYQQFPHCVFHHLKLTVPIEQITPRSNAIPVTILITERHFNKIISKYCLVQLLRNTVHVRFQQPNIKCTAAEELHYKKAVLPENRPYSAALLAENTGRTGGCLLSDAAAEN
jgi:hypothetical protein